MSPISSDKGSPMKTASSSNVEEEVTKAKKSRLESSDDIAGCNNVKIELPEYESASEDEEFVELGGVIKKEKKKDDNFKSSEFPTLSDSVKQEVAGREMLKATRSQTLLKGDRNKLLRTDGDQIIDRGDGEGNLKRPLSSNGSVGSLGAKEIPNFEVETDSITLGRRQKQIEYGKNTSEYLHYVDTVPRKERQSFHPKTPNIHRKYSRRAWDGLVRQWRLNLHCWSQNAGGTRADAKMELGASASDYGDDKLNESFNSELESIAETDSTSSSISAAFTFGVTMGTPVKIEPKIEKEDLDTTITESSALNQSQGETSKLLNDSTSSGGSNNDKLSTSWADEVEDEYYSCESQEIRS